ncbi:MAG: hypothetical protein RMY64_30495 [Nostoc sp. DedQUE08]|uniref:hypothetical protein n=1 Tax=unclassified Nostoc TaxID=2593658 RepID=UPI002AD512D6|nr:MULTISPECIES: hypothetical protein [unclassified Nostoc]MDZ8069890.1 hypothetical protein [Nostoc sp. DedQUE08]MDZ8096977.1 hypothetical protein [Nostoc sp. DedQUE05]MDZ8134178.1 hypothetical protein [Nostoc sp. DedQUE04]
MPSSTFIERCERSDQGLSLLNPYQDYLLSRWNSGNYNFTPLLNEVEEMQSILVASLNKLKA